MIEITEGVVLGNADEAISKMHALNKMGVTISMDDFGAGYSSLTCLKAVGIFRAITLVISYELKR